MYTAPIMQKACSWVNSVFKIPGCVQKHFPMHLHSQAPRKRLVRRLRVIVADYIFAICNMYSEITANYKIFVVNPPLKLSSNEPMKHDWNKIIVNKILSPLKSFLKENNFCFKKLVAMPIRCVAPGIHTLQYLKQRFNCTTDNIFIYSLL